jgi:hypothetical protein
MMCGSDYLVAQGYHTAVGALFQLGIGNQERPRISIFGKSLGGWHDTNDR